MAAAPAVPPSDDLVVAWQRVVEEVMGKKAMVGAILANGRPVAVNGGELSVAITVSQFQRDLLTDRGNREIVMQAIRRSVAGATSFTLAADNGGGSSSGSAGSGGGGPASHPAVQAAIAEFGGEVVAVRPRPREGEGQ